MYTSSAHSYLNLICHLCQKETKCLKQDTYHLFPDPIKLNFLVLVSGQHVYLFVCLASQFCFPLLSLSVLMIGRWRWYWRPTAWSSSSVVPQDLSLPGTPSWPLSANPPSLHATPWAWSPSLGDENLWMTKGKKSPSELQPSTQLTCYQLVTAHLTVIAQYFSVHWYHGGHTCSIYQQSYPSLYYNIHCVGCKTEFLVDEAGGVEAKFWGEKFAINF